MKEVNKMFEDDEVLKGFLENAVHNAKEQIKREGKLTTENAVPLLLKAQFNHIVHLDLEISNLRNLMDTRFIEMEGRFDARFEKIDQRFEKIEGKFDKICIFLGIGFTIIASLVTVFKFF